MLSSDVEGSLSIIGERILQCGIHICHSSRSEGNELLLKYVCALLNSGGGVIQLENVDSRSNTQSKDLDVWWSGMENKLSDILSRDDICNYFDLVGNFDDEKLFLFVKTAEYLCTVDYHSRLPTDTATHELTYHSAIKLLANSGLPQGNILDLPKIPQFFEYGQTEETLKQETKQIQFKLLTFTNRDSKKLPDKVRQMVIKYVSSFGNHEGGHIYFGIEDKTAAAYGEVMNDSDEKDIVWTLTNRMELVIWNDPSIKAVRGVQWDVQFIPVLNYPPTTKGTRKVIVVSICKVPGGVFTTCPESFYISHSGAVKLFPYNDWKEKMLLPLQEIKSLHNRFVRVPMHVPSSILIYTLPHTVASIKEKLFKMSKGHQLYPKYFLDSITNPSYRIHITKTLKLFEDHETIQIVIQSWGFNISGKPNSVLCDIFIISCDFGFHLLTFSETVSMDIQQYSQRVASILKTKLVLEGGCTEKFGILSHVINLQDETAVSSFDRVFNGMLRDLPYPSHYKASTQKIDHMLRSLIIWLGKYKTHDLQQKKEFYFLLTCDQFELLWMNQNVKELWVHGPPGSGKTVAAVQVIKELCRRGCNKENILYIAENELLCNYVSSFNICVVKARRELMAEYTKRKQEYSMVKNVIVDGAQNFKDRDGDWYSLAQMLANQNQTIQSDLSVGYFWVFMDYAQKVHKFKAGLPGILGKNNFVLSEISRNSTEIYNFASHYMDIDKTAVDNPGLTRNVSYPKLGHSYSSGNIVDIIHCEREQVLKSMQKVLIQLYEDGLSLDDIAILVSKKKDAEVIKPVTENSDDVTGGVPTVDTVKGFSGLDKPVIVGVEPEVNEDHASFDKYMVNLATRAKEKLIIITSSDSRFT